MPEKRVTIVGAGLAGSLLSIMLARRGYEVHVYERRADMRKTEISAGRSINLALSTRGLYALSRVGMREKILSCAIPMRGRMVHELDGSTSFQPYSQFKSDVINSVSRADLNMRLMDEAQLRDDVAFHFDKRCLGINLDDSTLTFESTGGEIEQVNCKHPVIGSDGSASALRDTLLHSGRFNFSQEYLAHGYKELTIPAGPNGEFALERNALHIWPRRTFMLIALPNLDASFTCTLFLSFEGEKSFQAISNETDLETFFETEFPDVLTLIPNLTENFFSNPTGSLVTIRCYPWAIADQLCLLGDASHAVVPFFGQGMNAAFEDCSTLDAVLEQLSPNPEWRHVFSSFQQSRKPNADAIARMALENYYEMRDHVVDPDFLFRKTLAFELEKRFPERYKPRYSMVTFSRMPYAVAEARGLQQQALLSELCSGCNSIDKIDWNLARELVSELPPLTQDLDNAASKS